ncbi:MAG: hypothetical protein HY698_04240 [Deltaproteobacteria bacterium]|nr:hypothetical protein [Deltaproteobacteria bacterium]
MSRRRVLAISPDLERLRLLVSTLERAGAEVDAVLDPSAVEGEVIPHRYIFFAWNGDVSPLEELLPRVRQKAHVAAVVPRAPLGVLTQLLSDPRCNHVLVGDEGDRGVYITAKKLLTGDIFGIEKYLPEGTEVNYVRLRDFQGRTNAISTIQKYAESKGVRRQVRAAIGQVCEELLMNALYDAPVDESGHQIFAEVDPHDRTGSLSPRPVSIRFAATESQFAVAVRDRFGRLAKDTILAYISKCLNSEQQIDRKTYGAGLGLYLVANAAAGYVVNVAHGMATEVVCTFDRGSKAPLRLVGVFVHPGQAAAQHSSESGGASAA